MATSYTSLLGLALPTTGELQGTWGDTVNNAITSLLDTAVAGTTTLSTDADVTLTTTTGASNQARQAILLCSGARTAARNITAPAQSKIYTVINSTTGGYAVVIRGAGPTTGVTIPAGKAIQVAWNGSDFVELSPNSITGNLTVGGNLTVNGNTTLGDASADTVTVNGTITSNLIFTDATYDIGSSGANRPRSLYLSNALTVGTYAATGAAVDSGVAFFARNSNLTGTFQYGFIAAHTATSASTSGVAGFTSSFATAAASFTTSSVYGFLANNVTKGSGSTITNQYGLFVDDQTNGNSNYGAYLAVTSGSNKWNIYSSGTASNYLRGQTVLGTATTLNTGADLQINTSLPQITLQTTATSTTPGAFIQLLGAGPTSGYYNYAIGANYQTAGVLEFLRSTATGGSSTTTTMAQINSSGALNLGAGGAFINGYMLNVYGGATQNLASIALDGTNTSGGLQGSLSWFGRYTVGSSAQFERARMSVWNTDDSFASTNKQSLVFYTRSGTTGPTANFNMSFNGDLYVGSGSAPTSMHEDVNTSYQNLFIGTVGNLYSGSPGANFGVVLSANGYQKSGGTQVRIQSGYSVRFDCRADDGSFVWYQAGNSTAGTTITYGTYMLFDGNSRLTIGGDSSYTASSYRMTIVPYSSLGIYCNGANHTMINGGNEFNPVYNNSSGTDLYINYRAVYAFNAMRFMNGQSTYVACYATSFNPVSDYRMKENLVPYQEAALPKIMGMNFFSYNFIKDGQNRRYLGGLAHDLKAQEDLLVHGEKDQVDEDGDILPQSVDPVAWCALLSKAMQELKNEFDAYKLAHP